MPRITITETDTTSSVSTEEFDYAVYVPGFSLAAVNPDAANPDFDASVQAANGASTGAPVNTPVYCATLSQFRLFFGSENPKFLQAQGYPVLSSDSKGFAENAIPNEQMYNQGTVDPGYLYAEELLSMGIPVVYERMNKWNTCNSSYQIEISVVATAPDSTTEGEIGDYLLYVNSATNYQDLYVCTNKIIGTTATTYEWAVLEHQCSYTVATEGSVVLDYDITVSAMYNQLYKRFVTEAEILEDKSLYSLRFISSGGYPTFEYCLSSSSVNNIAAGMVAVAENRGDCVALIDHTNNKYRSLTGSLSVYQAINNSYPINSSFAAMFTPWVRYAGNYITGAAAPSIAYLASFANSIYLGNAEWLAIAGKTRGVSFVSALNCNTTMTQAIADRFVSTTGISINPIINLGSSGFVIWGNRTLRANTGYNKATSYLNLRMLTNVVKRTVWEASIETSFEQNSDILWVNYKALISKVLDTMMATSGIKGYTINRLATDDRTAIAAQIILVPTYAVENFEINVYLTDDETLVSEESTEE